MIVKLRQESQTAIEHSGKAVEDDVSVLDVQQEYAVLFLTCDSEGACVYLDLGKPYAEGFNLRFFTITDATLPPYWHIGFTPTQRHGRTDFAVLLGPHFWANDVFWYERLLDNDEVARREYADYLRAVGSRSVSHS